MNVTYGAFFICFKKTCTKWPHIFKMSYNLSCLTSFITSPVWMRKGNTFLQRVVACLTFYFSTRLDRWTICLVFYVFFNVFFCCSFSHYIGPRQTPGEGQYFSGVPSLLASPHLRQEMPFCTPCHALYCAQVGLLSDVCVVSHCYGHGLFLDSLTGSFYCPACVEDWTLCNTFLEKSQTPCCLLWLCDTVSLFLLCLLSFHLFTPPHCLK